jgi:hypothetical protein
MTFKIDNRSLNVRGFTVQSLPVYSEMDEIADIGEQDAPILKHVVTPFGAYRKFEVEAIEDKTVVWDNSVVKYLQDKMKSGVSVNLEISESWFSYSGAVWIIDLSAEFDASGVKTYRVVLQEVI